MLARTLTRYKRTVWHSDGQNSRSNSSTVPEFSYLQRTRDTLRLAFFRRTKITIRWRPGERSLFYKPSTIFTGRFAYVNRELKTDVTGENVPRRWEKRSSIICIIRTAESLLIVFLERPVIVYESYSRVEVSAGRHMYAGSVPDFLRSTFHV